MTVWCVEKEEEKYKKKKYMYINILSQYLKSQILPFFELYTKENTIF